MVMSAGKIMLIAVGVYFLSAVLPGAFDNFFGADTSSWDAGTAALWLLIPLGIIAVIVFAYLPKGGG